MLHAPTISSRPVRRLLAVGVAVGALGAALFFVALLRGPYFPPAPVAPAAARPAAPRADAASARPPAPPPLSPGNRAVILANAQVARFRAQVLLDAQDDPINRAPGAILDRPVVLRYGPGNGGWVFQITPEQLRKASIKRVNGTFTLDKAKVSAYLAPVAEALRAAPRDATLGVKEGRAVLTPDQPGLELDVNAAFTSIQEAAADPARRVAFLALKPVAAQVRAATLRPTYETLHATLERGFVLRYNGEEYKLKPATMARYITLTETEDAPAPYAIGIDHDKLLTTLDIVARQVNVVARDPLYREVNGEVVQVIAPAAGRRLDYEATAAAMTAAFAAGRSEADMVVGVRPSNVTSVYTGAVQTPDLLGKASTSFSGSMSARAHNVRFGAELVDNMLIPPGAIFSMNDALGPLTLEAGFKMGFGITRDQKGALVTIPSEAGGICQVATTFFQSAYWAGLPVVERRNHSYWIPRYGQGATGRKGLDATISPPDQDLRVKNTTGNWIRVHAYSNGETVLFELYGTNPGWTVKVSDPVIKNVVKTDGRVYTDKSDLLPAGQRVWAEHRQDGFTASITRQVLDATGAVIDDLTLTSRYEPAYDRYIVGTGKAVPKP
jgi:vancomycin resistance protein YoaR